MRLGSHNHKWHRNDIKTYLQCCKVIVVCCIPTQHNNSLYRVNWFKLHFAQQICIFRSISVSFQQEVWDCMTTTLRISVGITIHRISVNWKIQQYFSNLLEYSNHRNTCCMYSKNIHVIHWNIPFKFPKSWLNSQHFGEIPEILTKFPNFSGNFQGIFPNVGVMWGIVPLLFLCIMHAFTYSVLFE